MAKQQKIRLRKDVTTVNGLTFKAGDELFVHSVTVRDSPQSTRGICGLGYELFELVAEQAQAVESPEAVKIEVPEFDLPDL